MRIRMMMLATMLCAGSAHALDGTTSPLAAPDRAGGVYRLVPAAKGLWVWHSLGDGSPAIGYATAQLVDSTHAPSWGTIAADGFGGALISYRAVSGNAGQVRTMRAQPGLAPAPGWAMHGDQAATTPVGPGYHGLASDFAGGLYTAWQDFRTSYNDQNVVLQHMSSTAQVASGWPLEGLFVCDAPGDQYDPVLATDAAGGVIASWWDGRALGNTDDTGFDIWAQSIAPEGSVRWAANGVPVTRAAGDQTDPAIISDTQGGALIAWTEQTAPFPQAGYGRIGMQRLNSTGNITSNWPTDGLLLGDAALTRVLATQPALVSDAQGGGYTMWADAPAGSLSGGPWTTRVQHVAANGVIAPGWPLSGRAVATANRLLIPLGLVTDGQSGVIAAWLDLLDETTSTQRVWLQRLGPSGGTAPGWPGTGIQVTESALNYAAMVEDHFGGATLSWFGAVLGAGELGPPIARRITHEGVLDPYWGGYPYVDGQPVTSPTPSPGAVNITFALPTPSSVEARVFDLTGRRVRDLGRTAEAAAGRRTQAWDGRNDAGEAVPAGLYFVRIRWSERDHTARVVIAR